MKKRKKELKKLKGCEDCMKKCLWNGPVASKDTIQDEICNDLYRCNSNLKRGD